MIRSILVPLDGSRFAERAVPTAETLARRTGARVFLVRVHVPLPLGVFPGWQATVDAELQHAETAYLEDHAEALAQRGVRAEAVALSGSAPLSLRVAAESCPRAVIVMASHRRRPLERALYGSVADSLIRRSGCPVLLVGESATVAPAGFRRVVIPLDGSPGAESVVESAFEIAGPVTYLLVHVRPANENRQRALGNGEGPTDGPVPESLLGARTLLEGMGAAPAVRVLREARVAEAIAEIVRGGDLIAITAKHGRGRRLLFGGTTDRLVRAVPDGAVLLFRPRRRSADTGALTFDGVARHGPARSPTWRGAGARRGARVSGAGIGDGAQ